MHRPPFAPSAPFIASTARATAASLVIFALGCSSAGSSGTADGGVPHPSDSSGTTDGVVSHPPAVHREVATACAATPPTTVKTCATDADCASSPPSTPSAPGRCVAGACTPDACVSDDDCGAGHMCSCKGKTRGFGGSSAGNVCIVATCRTDGDCGAGGYCSPTYNSCGAFYGVQGWYCHTRTDDCSDDSDCGSDGGFGQAWCGYDTTVGKWACMTGGCAG